MEPINTLDQVPTASGDKELNDERRQKKKEYDKKRREQLKSNPALAEEMKLKEQNKYKKKLEKKQIKLVRDMSPLEHRRKKELWRQRAKEAYRRKKGGSSLPKGMTSTSHLAQQIADGIVNERQRNFSKINAKAKELEKGKEIETFNDIVEILQKRDILIKNCKVIFGI